MSAAHPAAGTAEASTHRPRPVRASAGEDVEVRFTVNGTPAELRVPARLTLSDALRDHLGLTGTHVGCEHGVCGMCTVLVDGDAARACLLFACQVDGSDVVTVEGLGRPDDLHPLQEAFGRNHALQCGFCTPGFLMSSYDLLSHTEGLDEEDLPEELSGVICRCTGYRNIVRAVAETAEAYPDGPPPPGNCVPRVLAGRAGRAGAVTGTGGAPQGEDEDATEAAGDAAARAPIVLPESEPTISVDITSDLAISQDRVWRVLDDVPLLASCLPGAELTDDHGEGRYSGRARVSVGPVKLSFVGVAHIVERDPDGGRLRVLAQGEETGGARTQGDVLLTTESTETGTRLRAVAGVHLTGRIAQFGRALAGDISRRMFEQFTESLAEAATTGDAPLHPRPAPSALALLGHSLRARLRHLVARLRGRGRPGNPGDQETGELR